MDIKFAVGWRRGEAYACVSDEMDDDLSFWWSWYTRYIQLPSGCLVFGDLASELEVLGAILPIFLAAFPFAKELWFCAVVIYNPLTLGIWGASSG